MQGMLRRDLKSLQLLAHPNIVRVMAVVTDAASQPVGFIMEPSPPPGRRHAMQHMTLPHVRVLVTLCCCLLRAARVRHAPHTCRYRSFASGQVPVHWVVHFDARGERAFRYRCKNVNLVEKTVKGVEDELEFLFVP